MEVASRGHFRSTGRGGLPSRLRTCPSHIRVSVTPQRCQNTWTTAPGPHLTFPTARGHPHANAAHHAVSPEATTVPAHSVFSMLRLSLMDGSLSSWKRPHGLVFAAVPRHLGVWFLGPRGAESRAPSRVVGVASRRLRTAPSTPVLHTAAALTAWGDNDQRPPGSAQGPCFLGRFWCMMR